MYKFYYITLIAFHKITITNNSNELTIHILKNIFKNYVYLPVQLSHHKIH